MTTINILFEKQRVTLAGLATLEALLGSARGEQTDLVGVAALLGALLRELDGGLDAIEQCLH